jgi:hypothetical protein
MRRVVVPLLALGIFTLTTSVPIVAERETAEAIVTPRRTPSFTGLEPGAFVVHKQAVRIDIVLIGFDNARVDRSELSALLPATYTPAVRYPQLYGLSGRDVGLRYNFTYSLTRKSKTFEDQFFRYLARAGRPGAPTAFQQAYNNQQANLVNVTGPVLYIDAPSVERWLDNNAHPRSDGYTVYFINWYGRSDFKFHVYTKLDETDPDTGFNFGSLANTAMNSWGGTRSRTWFYDFSAGPEWNTTNWVVDDEDLDGDGVAEYRMPPIWEYAANGYRSPDALGYDMGLLTRYVAIDLLFTPSPLYDPLITAPQALGRKVAHITMLEDDAASHGADFIDPAFATDAWERFQPYYRWRTALRDVDPIDAGAKQSLDIFTLNKVVPGCWNDFGTPFAQLFCFFDLNLAKYVPTYPVRDYVAKVFSFNTTEEGLGAQFGLLGFADDNWVDGTQSYVFTFDSDVYRELGYGFTATTVHEVGHHIGMSHPHDGFDAETGVDYDAAAGGEFFFAWAGDESDTVMHYLSISNQFGEHNRDNMYRWETAGYLNWANALAGDILQSPDVGKVWLALIAADAQATAAQARLNAWNFLAAVERARAAYLLLVEAADEIGVSSARLSAARMRLPESRIRKYVCRPRQLVERLQTR